MALSDLWIASPEQLAGKHVRQIISFSGTAYHLLRSADHFTY